MDAAGEETVGQRLRRLRLERGMSQRDLAGPGVTFAYVSRIENGTRKPSLDVLRLLARKLRVPLEYLETGAKVPEAAERELRLSDAELELRLGRDLDRAAEVFQAEAKRGDEPALEARARAGLGQLAARRSDHQVTIRELEAVTGSGYFPPEARPDLYRTLAAAYVAVDEPRRAVELFKGCLAELREHVPDDAALQVRYAVYLATACGEAGDMTGAQQALADANEAAKDEPASAQIRINLYWANAREAWFEADSEGALIHIHRAIGLLETTEDTYHLALAHLLCAQLLSLDGRGDEAARHLDRAERLFVLGADDSDLGVLRAEQAKLAALRNDADAAMTYANEAARLLGDDARHLGLKWHALASAHRLAGDVGQAEIYFGKAVDALTERRQWREAATVASEWGRFLRALGRDGEAFDLMDRATLLHIRHVGRQAVRARDAKA
jgi:transcriptional regulator with XRE-family HTH domain